MKDGLTCQPIGFFQCIQAEKYMVPKQAELGVRATGRILLEAGCNFEQALNDLHGFERIWLIYWFHRNRSWKPKVLTPRGGAKRGVFATRSPHRPNPIGLSCVELLEISGREILIGKHDLIDGTPILDIKPYLCYADAFPKSQEGWTENRDFCEAYEVGWSETAMEQAQWIESEGQLNLVETVELRLTSNPFPFPSHRIKKVGEDTYVLACKTWRICYNVKGQRVMIDQIESGYDQATLRGGKPSRWDDVPVHREFIAKFRG